MALTKIEILKAANEILKEYDGSAPEAAAEIWAEENLGMVKARRGEAGIDGTLPNGRTLQVKSKKHGAHSDAGTYITMSDATLRLANDLLIVFVDHDTLEVARTLGPVAIDKLSSRRHKGGARYVVSDILKAIG